MSAIVDSISASSQTKASNPKKMKARIDRPEQRPFRPSMRLKLCAMVVDAKAESGIAIIGIAKRRSK